MRENSGNTSTPLVTLTSLWPVKLKSSTKGGLFARARYLNRSGPYVSNFIIVVDLLLLIEDLHPVRKSLGGCQRKVWCNSLNRFTKEEHDTVRRAMPDHTQNQSKPYSERIQTMLERVKAVPNLQSNRE